MPWQQEKREGLVGGVKEEKGGASTSAVSHPRWPSVHMTQQAGSPQDSGIVGKKKDDKSRQ